MNEFVYIEKKMAENAGVSERAFAATRQITLEEGVDWIHGKRKQVLLNKAGLDKVLQKLGILGTGTGDQNPQDEPEKEIPADLRESIAESTIEAVQRQEKNVVILIVSSRKYPNKHILAALKDDQLVRVHVKSSKNFRKGMEIPVRWLKDDLYELTRACPRRPGKW